MQQQEYSKHFYEAVMTTYTDANGLQTVTVKLGPSVAGSGKWLTPQDAQSLMRRIQDAVHKELSEAPVLNGTKV